MMPDLERPKNFLFFFLLKHLSLYEVDHADREYHLQTSPNLLIMSRNF